jgi:arylsulfatase A-like enzyme
MEVRRNIDREYLTRADAFIRRSVAAGTPFYVYFNHSMLHLPTVPRDEFKGQSGVGDWADCLLEMDADFGTLLDLLAELNIADNTIVVFAGDNGPEDALPWRGTAGYWAGSYFTGMEGSLRTPCLIRWPGHVAPGRISNEIVHVTDMFTTLISWAGCQVPSDRVIDGVDQGAFFCGEQDQSNRQGFLFWNGDKLYGVKWQNFKMSANLDTLARPIRDRLNAAGYRAVIVMDEPLPRGAFTVEDKIAGYMEAGDAFIALATADGRLGGTTRLRTLPMRSAAHAECQICETLC